MADSNELRVLVVDDDPALARVLRILLTSEGFLVSLAGDGQEALTVASAVAPDLVILDLQMPVMDGRTFYKEFRQQGFRSPVIILSAYNAEGARKELGAEAAVNKPFDPDMIGEVVRNLVGRQG